MKIYASWTKAVITVTAEGALAFEAEVDIMDETIGKLGQRGLTAPPEAAAQFAATLRPFMEGLLPAMSQFAGMPVTLPTATSEGTTATPVPTPPVTS